ncbi:5-bromo-4-chloroindolyl phosphate hydrolysis family protein [Vermiculatibacterium agrestimuris]|uniref:5-bromo-4-chloroindolyl phosphate hydrolysis family protein n=1 Tax=Vermiculatibacterium agrestimuris TaxID=2941519 RepID=UPI0020420B3C|nr:5-bromo-4-chloroindolyl phosphate hydrolysis family protein [Vermiculatibacterium agrestimuris]
MAKQVKRSPAPLYLAAAVWLVWGLFLPLYRLPHILAAAVLSAVAGLIGKSLFPDKIYEIPEQAKPQEPEKPKSTGDPELDALLAERDRALSEIRRLNDAIPGEKISAQIDRLEEDTRKIMDHVVEHPEKLPQIKRFMGYYLPTTLKLLNAYDRMGAAGVSGENIDGTKGRIDAMMDTIVAAFDKQLDALFADEALDISTDITVMENLLKQEGLSEEKPFAANG